MAVAFVLINVEPGTETKILSELRKVPFVKEAHFVYGVYDIVVEVEADAMEKLKDIVASKIRMIEGVEATTTMIVVQSA